MSQNDIDILSDFIRNFTAKKGMDHLVGQAKQIAQERQNLLQQITQEREERAVMMESFYDLFISLMKNRRECIYVVDMEKEELLYYNKDSEQEKENGDLSVNLLIMLWKNEPDDSSRIKEYKNSKNDRLYFIRAFDVIWRGKHAKTFMVEDVTKAREEEKRLSDMAYRDSFTGVFNRHYLEEYLESLINTGAHFSFCYLDINHLKQVNDMFGHAEGDRYIKQIVSLILNGIRSTDTLARIGGDEFGVILLKCPKDMAANKINILYQKALNLSGGMEAYEISFSYGVVESGGGVFLDCGEECTVDMLLQKADEAMYQFKKGLFQ